MSATRETEHYQLPLFDPTDKPTWQGDWNSTMTDLDAAIYAASQTGSGESATAQEALAKATEALNTANNASSAAASAQQNASQALTLAQSASELSSQNGTAIEDLESETATMKTSITKNAQDIITVQTTATGADSKATTAQTNAQTALTKATSAESTANQAKTTATQAQTTANNADTMASSAQTTATSALTTANNAMKRLSVFVPYVIYDVFGESGFITQPLNSKCIIYAIQNGTNEFYPMFSGVFRSSQEFSFIISFESKGIISYNRQYSKCGVCFVKGDGSYTTSNVNCSWSESLGNSVLQLTINIPSTGNDPIVAIHFSPQF